MPSPRYCPEPVHTHGLPARTAILFCNLGTPDDPTTGAVRRYLREFLSDPRVVEIPRVAWWPILHGIILRTRPAKSAAKYQSVWTDEGSPLRIWTQKQALLLQGWLAQRGHDVLVRHAMRYGKDSIAEQLDALKAQGVQRILVLPAYPQYSAATTASVFDAVYAWGQRTRTLPELRFVNRYHDEPLYIDALAKNVHRHWQAHGRGQVLVMSFHGLPQRTLTLGDPYFCECQKTARLLANRLALREEEYRVTFQSRLGRAQWLQPYTEPTLVALAQAGTVHADVVCPGFTSDCLETLEEIAMEAREAFLHAGGREFQYIPALNDQPEWISAMQAVALRHLQGWDTQSPRDSAKAGDTRRRAMEMGATQ
jgi:ferrochelatase